MRRLVMVVAETAGGANTAYAIKIAENHKAGMGGIPTVSEKVLKTAKRVFPCLKLDS